MVNIVKWVKRAAVLKLERRITKAQTILGLMITKFEDSKVIDKGNYKTWKALESWYTARIRESDNNSKTLLVSQDFPRPILLSYEINRLQAYQEQSLKTTNTILSRGL